MFGGGKKKADAAGTSIDNSYVISAAHSLEGIPKEYAALERRFGKRDVDWKVIDRRTIQSGAKMIEHFVLSARGGRQDVYFDITSWIRANTTPGGSAAFDLVTKTLGTLPMSVAIRREPALFLLEMFSLVGSSDRDRMRREKHPMAISEEDWAFTLSALQPAASWAQGQRAEVSMPALRWLWVQEFLKMVEPKDALAATHLDEVRASIDDGRRMMLRAIKGG